ncbi:hypothetical protein ROZALSC1DRAFT_29659 [Rozella allomycis CSF55]|uniref:Helitron helicase-like domain-containing protein n=1 Tax=Rozella allomycis (strain CSF55) TaxID=988480 RepID=A0A075B4N8_ROZAC|nr:hypothetical protein O9G_005711 [Rozella allomycis CSF55]RKP18672.1 hypothetical protein ROZALSC1DRAFT_29659 [Rozella allomycis CSF55]|eukprot:EPZ36338.1 hypothetical protein O9G_005711 [Rozella allomycis CSF55]
MSAYSANITGSQSFRYHRRVELEHIFLEKVIEQYATTGTVFWTASYSDNHQNHCHRLMPLAANTASERYRNCLRNPHLVDWFFEIRSTEFLKALFDDVLNAEYEWQSRTSIHAHGTTKFKNDPGLCELTTKAYVGRLMETLIDPTQQEVIDAGKNSSNIVLKYAQWLLTASNPRVNRDEHPGGVPDPHPCSKRILDIIDDAAAMARDYEELCNCCQRHVCRPGGYCKRKKARVNGKPSRFDYHMDLSDKAELVFIETDKSVRAEIRLPRNDETFNIHNRLQHHHWRANVDMQIILDKHAAIRYMVKYASKGEKESGQLQDVYNTVKRNAKEDDSIRRTGRCAH